MSGRQLRYYQQGAVDAIYKHLAEQDGSPCAVLPTGAGKTPVIARIANDVAAGGGRVLVLAHVKELLAQAEGTIAEWHPGASVGVYSAGLSRREMHRPITLASIQSIHRKAEKFEPWDLILVDEAHRIPPDGDGMFRSFIDDAKTINPHCKLAGLTATPYRLNGGHVVGEGRILSRICYEASVRELIAGGYLSRLTSRSTQNRVDLSEVRVKSGEFVAAELDDIYADSSAVIAAVEEIAAATEQRQSVLVFCCGVAHAQAVGRFLGLTGQDCRVVTGETPPAERERIADDFKAGRIKFLVNVNVYTEGFDATCVDCVVLLRPTLSPALYYQMVGRGFRLHPGKNDCLVLDFGENIRRHGCVDDITIGRPAEGKPREGEAPVQECTGCKAMIGARYQRCPECGQKLSDEKKELKHGDSADGAAITSDQVEAETLEVLDVGYQTWVKRGSDPEKDPRTMRVDYQVEGLEYVSEWVCVEHTGFARNKAERWWSVRTRADCPTDADLAVRVASAGILEPVSLTIKRVPGKPFPEIVGFSFTGPPLPAPELGPEVDPFGEEVAGEGPADLADDSAGWLSFDDSDIPF